MALQLSGKFWIFQPCLSLSRPDAFTTNCSQHWLDIRLVCFSKILIPWASLVAQWLRICLLMQGTRVRALVWEDPTSHGAAGPVSHNYSACASGACAPQQEGP